MNQRPARTTALIQSVMEVHSSLTNGAAPAGKNLDPRQAKRRQIKAQAQWIEVDERLAHLDTTLIQGQNDDSINRAIDDVCYALNSAAHAYKFAGITTIRKPPGI